MPKPKSLHRCTACGTEHRRWQGQCTGCGEWNTLAETAAPTARSGHRPASAPVVESLNGPARQLDRLSSGLGEFDRVLGGGFVPGSAILLGGDPGIGKSTVVLQTLAAMAGQGARCTYVSGEESVEQVRRRAERLGVLQAAIGITTATQAEAILELMHDPDAPQILVVDSVQMLVSAAVDAAAGSPSQMRTCAHSLIQAAKSTGVTLLLIGHVTKDSAIAGPKQIEHMVDAVLRVDQETSAQFRILRATKNRFGSIEEVGVFAMGDAGLQEVPNPSELFLGDRRTDLPGSAIFPGIEGSRPMLVEIQTLVAATQYGTPRRTVVGWDQGRLAMLVAVLQARCGLPIADQDIYLNVSGGVRISEPAADLAVAAALISSCASRPLPADAVWFGEVGLGGEIRGVAHGDRRIREARKLGFQHIVGPQSRGRQTGAPSQSVDTLLDLVTSIGTARAA
jgi:DNA repair protein RadA/Sms